uniref:Pleurocidin n=1 Tax=Pseudopleuronectes americanus TaxID=8265 RepID=PLE1_PSEAM|nr:RecName: Full=Pleurocidin; Flags: Precursor [Pseudopleuronectes americanus]AAF17252.1 antimicrobial peptide pleurocidin [Pseudopleuronectes americanus]AAF17253.1 antimicrobial peptide pleurocidin [Pseudopleuronectes americanus]AAG10397.1 pleurocidin 2 prepropolypeptide [Pseudopleuronectes americanus]
MKFTATFLMMAIFVLMVEPGECGWGSFFKKAAHVGKHVGKAALTHYLGDKQELNKRAVDEDPNVIVFE